MRLARHGELDPRDRGGKAQPLLIADGLRKYFPVRGGVFNRQVATVQAVDDVTFTVQKGETLDAVAGDAKVKPIEEKGIGRNAANLDHAIVDAVFNLERPQAGKPSVGRVGLADDAYALVALDVVTDGDPSKLDAKTKEAARNTLRQALGSEATRGFVDSLKKAADIKIAEDRLQ